MKLGSYLAYIRREMRGSLKRLAFFIACLAVGVAAVVAVGSLIASVNTAIRENARNILAADMVVRSRANIPDKVLEAIDAIPGAERTMRREMIFPVSAPTRGLLPGRSERAHILVVEGEYPLHGRMELTGGKSMRETLDAETAVVSRRLMDKLELDVGDKVSIGGARYVIGAAVEYDSGDLNWEIGLAGRAFINGEGLSRTSLYSSLISKLHEPLFRSTREAMIRLPNDTTKAELDAIAANLRTVAGTDAVKVESYADGIPALSRPLERLGIFLGMTALLSLLIGGIGVAQTVRAWIASRLDAIATLKCLGMRPWQILSLYLGQTVALALMGSIVGAVLGVAGSYILRSVFSRIVPELLVAPIQTSAILDGVLLGVGVAVAFSLPVLAQVLRVSPAMVIRNSASPLPPSWFTQGACWSLLLLGLYLAAVSRIGSYMYGLYFTLFLIVAALLLALAARVVSRVAGVIPRSWGGFWLKHGLSALQRPGAGTTSAMIAVGLGVMVVLGVNLIQKRINDSLTSEIPTSAPSAFMLNIQESQRDAFAKSLEDLGATDIKMAALYKGELVMLRGATGEQLRKRNQGQEERLNDVGRQQRLSARDEIPFNEELREGAWWDEAAKQRGLEQWPNADGEYPLSPAAEIAGALRLKINDRITLNLSGQDVKFVVTSIRTVDWGALNISFMFLTMPEAVEGVRHQYIATAKVAPDKEDQVKNELARQYPFVNLIIVSRILSRVRAVLDDFSLAVTLLGWFTVSAGIIILGGAITASAVRRAREAALLKTLGMRKAGVLSAFAVEYALIGVVSAIIGIVGAAGMDFLLTAVILQQPFTPTYIHYAAAMTVTAVLTIAAGLASSYGTLNRPAWQTIREA